MAEEKQQQQSEQPESQQPKPQRPSSSSSPPSDKEKRGDKPKDAKDAQPEGGYDATPLRPTPGNTYTVKITFHSCSNLPVSDYASRTADPFIHAQLNTGLPTRHHQDPPLRFRSQTIHKTLEPTWDAEWIVAGVPESGFTLKARVYDEDPGDHDDRLGKVEIESGRLGEDWKGIHQEDFKVKKTGADIIAYTLRWGRILLCSGVELHPRLIVSIEVLEKTKEEVGKAYTVNNFWWVHYSPIIGRLAGTKAHDDKGVEKFNFQANEMQLRGPVPTQLYHRYVDFKPFVGGMFKGTGFRGTILHKALHHQHERIYNFDRQTKYGTFPNGPSNDMTLKFLDMVHYDQGGRIFTYVITLDGMFRFTETGKEFGIDLLSKHTMHSDVNIYIAWSGEFLIRRLSKPREKASAPDQHTHPAEDIPGGPPNDAPPKDPKYYELIIDNDSGTYRPNGDLLPVLKKFLKKNFPGLHVITKPCTDEGLAKMKKEQKKTKSKEGEEMVYGQGSDSGSISSSDEEELEERAQGDGAHPSGLERGLDALQHPGQAVKSAIPKSGKKEREERETEDDNTEGQAQKA